MLATLPTFAIPEIARLGRTLRAWRGELLAYSDTDGASNGPTEAMNLIIEKARRIGHGYRNFDNYRRRLLLHCGVDVLDPLSANGSSGGRWARLLIGRRGLVVVGAPRLLAPAGVVGRDAGGKLTSGDYLDPAEESQRGAGATEGR